MKPGTLLRNLTMNLVLDLKHKIIGVDKKQDR